jgi:hypothetical protein
MRLITFQDKDIISEFLDTGVWPRRYHLDRLDVLHDKKGLPAPIYTFASFPKNGRTGINMIDFVFSWDTLMGYMVFHGRNFLELEIPEGTYHTLCGMHSKEVITLEELVSYDSDVVECVIYEIKREWVVAHHKVEYPKDDNARIRITPIVINAELLPLIYKVYFVGDVFDTNGESIYDNKFIMQEIKSKLPDIPYKSVPKSDIRLYINPAAVDSYEITNPGIGTVNMNMFSK